MINARLRLPVKADAVRRYRSMLEDAKLPVEWAETSALEETLAKVYRSDEFGEEDVPPEVIVNGRDVSVAGMIHEGTYAKLREAVAGDGIETIHLHSFGGVAASGLAIYNLLKDNPTRIEVEGMAYSAAATIAMAGAPLVMKPYSMLGIHRPWGIAIGNAEDLRLEANALDVVAKAMLDLYLARGKGAYSRTIKKMYMDDTLIGANDAVKYGFADEAEGTRRKSEPKAEKEVVADEVAEKEAEASAGKYRSETDFYLSAYY